MAANSKIARGGVAVIILTFNEEDNLAQALQSVTRWAEQIFVLDSFSTDATVAIAQSFGCHTIQHKFENYAKQRNYALDNCPVTSEWVFFLDADEWLPEAAKLEMSALIASSPAENGFYINRRLIWMGQWIRRGYYPSWILRLFRHGQGRCEDRTVNEHLIVQGATARLRNDFVHQDRKGVTDWIAKHNRYATLEAMEFLNTRSSPNYREIDASLFGPQAQRKRWLRLKVWNRMPPLIRPFAYFGYRFVLTGGFMDGTSAFMYHFLQALWFPMLVDIKYLEMKKLRFAAQADLQPSRLRE
jgi:glycosyltransferase involved in cell wall biosynthesis